MLKRLQGKTPYRRSPYSLVGNGFMVMGDAAFQTKPFSGEGVTSSFTACRIAAEVAAEARRRAAADARAKAEQLARLHGGELRLVPTDEGACFELELPRASEGENT